MTGSVTLANIRLSLVAGMAFADFSEANILTNAIGGKLTVIDSGGVNKAVGYIKAAGSGETYTDIVGGTDPALNNGDFSLGDTGWAKSSGWSIADSKATCDGTSLASLSQHSLSGVGHLYKTFFSITTANSGGVRIEVGTAAVGTTRTTVASFTQYLTREAETVSRPLFRSFSFNGSIDSVTVQQVLTPSATGVTIVSTVDGTTQSWESVDENFNYNDSNGYTYSVDFAHGWGGKRQRGIRRWTDEYGNERVMYY